jgi:hypothetical protein
MKTTLACGLAVCLLAIVPVHGAVVEILIDFNNADTAPGTTYGQWNTIADADTTTSEALVDLDGDSTGITLNITNSFEDSHAVNQGEWTDVAHPWVDAQALGDYFTLNDYHSSGDETGQIVFTGLDQNSLYTFDLIGSKEPGGLGSREGDYKINGEFSDNDASDPGYSDNYHAANDGYNNHAVMTWADVAPVYNAGSDAWEITLDMEARYKHIAYLSAGRITFPVPEPATLTLLGVGGLVLAGPAIRRLRRRG